MLSRIISTYIADGIGFLAAAYLVHGFDIDLTNIPAFLILIAVFTAIHLVIRPLIKMVLTPLIILTLGLFNLVITGALLYIVDIYSQHITISGIVPLIYGTLILTAANLLLNTGHHLLNK